jgi:hypothetical protein
VFSLIFEVINFCGLAGNEMFYISSFCYLLNKR